MKTIFTLIFVVFSIVNLYAQDKLNFIDADSSYSVQYPSAWKVKSESFGKNRMASFEAPKTDENSKTPSAIVAFGKERLKKGITTIDAAVKPQLPALKKALGISSFTENKKVNGKQILVWQSKVKDQEIKNKLVMWVYKGYMYTYTYAANVKDYSKYAKEGDAILNSFKNLK